MRLTLSNVHDIMCLKRYLRKLALLTRKEDMLFISGLFMKKLRFIVALVFCVSCVAFYGCHESVSSDVVQSDSNAEVYVDEDNISHTSDDYLHDGSDGTIHSTITTGYTYTTPPQSQSDAGVSGQASASVTTTSVGISSEQGETTTTVKPVTTTKKTTTTVKPVTTTKKTTTTAKPVTTTKKMTTTKKTTTKVTTTTADKNQQLINEYVSEVLRLVNVERTSRGLTPFVLDTKLTRAAQVRAEEQKTRFGHTRPDGTSCFTVLTEFGISYSYAGENVAMGQRTPERVVSAWMNSDGHRANILTDGKDKQYTKVGIGFDPESYGWAMHFVG